MQKDNADTHPVAGQGDALDRGAGRASSGEKEPGTQPLVIDDELERPKEDRSPLT
jgi:hypothetical protein